MLINRDKLRGLMAERRIRPSYLIERLKLSRTAYYNKLDGKSSFNENEILILKEIFGNSIFL